MKTPDEIKREILQQWLEKAKEDIDVAKFLLSQETAFLSAVGFHAQQAVEKYLKAFLTWHEIEFPKTHDLEELLDLMGQVDEKLSASLRPVSILTRYGVEIRYPGDAPELTPDEAMEAVELATGAGESISVALK